MSPSHLPGRPHTGPWHRATVSWAVCGVTGDELLLCAGPQGGHVAEGWAGSSQGRVEGGASGCVRVHTCALSAHSHGWTRCVQCRIVAAGPSALCWSPLGCWSQDWRLGSASTSVVVSWGPAMGPQARAAPGLRRVRELHLARGLGSSLATGALLSGPEVGLTKRDGGGGSQRGTRHQGQSPLGVVAQACAPTPSSVPHARTVGWQG